VSPDGYHWTRLAEPILLYFHDTHNIGTWDAEAKKYRAYLRGHLGGRAIAYSETTDFRHWPPATVLLHPGPQDPPATDYYNNSFTTYPGIPELRFLFVSLFHHHNDLTAVRMAVSHNGTAFNWVSHEPVLEVGAPGEWDCGHVYAGPNLLYLPDGRLALPYTGGKLTHEGGLRHVYREGYPFDDDSGYAWAIWEDGRLAGIEADDIGEFWTVAQFDGRNIEINARAIGAGKVEVELGEPDGSGWNSRAIPGFSFDECIPFTGDSIWTTLRWKGHSDLSSLRGKLLVPHIRLTNAKIFGYRFAQ